MDVSVDVLLLQATVNNKVCRHLIWLAHTLPSAIPFPFPFSLPRKGSGCSFPDNDTLRIRRVCHTEHTLTLRSAIES